MIFLDKIKMHMALYVQLIISSHVMDSAQQNANVW